MMNKQSKETFDKYEYKRGLHFALDKVKEFELIQKQMKLKPEFILQQVTACKESLVTDMIDDKRLMNPSFCIGLKAGYKQFLEVTA